MRRLAVIFLAFILSALQSAAQVDSTSLRELDARLSRYFSLLEPLPVEVKTQECDALIEAAEDPSLRRQIALRTYRHYLNSTLMGDEAVAIYLTDKWFSSGKIAMESEADLLKAKLFADVNRQSLIGMRAPEVSLAGPYGEEVTLPVSLGGTDDIPRYQIYYFHDTDCAKCKLETAMLRSLLDDKGYPVDVVAVYVGRDEAGWRKWRESTFVLKPGPARVIHLWDPDDLSDYQLKYGVTVTPRMFLVDPDGIIIGRGLDTSALEILLSSRLRDLYHNYGDEESFALFDQLFSLYGPTVGPDDVAEVAGILEDRTLSRGDTLNFKSMEGDLLYYLAAQRSEGFREGSAIFVKDYILSRPWIWNTADDSLRVVGMAGMLDGLLGRTPVGSRIPRMPLKGWNKFRRKGGYLFFRSEGCKVCESEAAAADSLGIKCFSVNMDALERESPEIAGRLLDTFDLSALPAILKIGRRGVVERRYLSLADRLLFLEEKQ